MFLGVTTASLATLGADLKSDSPVITHSQAAMFVTDVAQPTGTRLKIAGALNTFFMF